MEPMSEFTPTVIALPCSGSNGSQWHSLAVMLNGHYRVLAPSLLNYAAAVATAPNRDFVLLDEARPVLEMLDRTVSPVHLVGHSYGGAVALVAAVERPQRINSVTLFEPTLFHLLEQTCPQDLQALRQVQQIANDVARLNALGRREDAAALFVDFWAGGCIWTKLRPAVRDALAQYVPKATLEFNALFNERMRLQDYATPFPVFIMEGEFAPAPTRRIARRLSATLPIAFQSTISGVGHMGPVTNAEQIAAKISNFIAQSHDRATPRARAAACSVMQATLWQQSVSDLKM